MQRWTSHELPALRARAKARKAQLLFADETSECSDYHAGTTWAPMGKMPIVRSSGQLASVNMISVISSMGELQFMLVQKNTNAEVFVSFLKQLVLSAKHSVILVVDGHRVHKSRRGMEYMESTPKMLELYYLPPYSPQLNPDEQVWKISGSGFQNSFRQMEMPCGNYSGRRLRDCGRCRRS